MNAGTIELPKTVGKWNRAESARIITAENIFKYMNGAGELYLGYRFRHLEVFDYHSPSQGHILVESYYMKSPDDAFGLLSLDWGGDPISFADHPAVRPNNSFSAPARALYGGGLLRQWSGAVYVRAMAEHETSASKEVVIALGKAIDMNTPKPPEPELVKTLPLQIGSAWKLRTDRLSFFRSHLVLNSIYYLSHENILNLDHSVEAVFAPYERTPKPGNSKRSQFLMVQYEDPERARLALNQFHDAYLPDYEKKKHAGPPTDMPMQFKLEDGWLAYKRIGKTIAIVFECPDRESAGTIIEKNLANLLNKGGNHE